MKFVQCLQALYTSKHLLMISRPKFLVYFRIFILLSVHSLHWSGPIIFIAEIGFIFCSTLKSMSAGSSCDDGLTFLGRIPLQWSAKKSDRIPFTISFCILLKWPVILFFTVCCVLPM